MPLDMRDWVPEDHLVNFINEAVSTIDSTVFHINRRGSGSEQYHPKMMLALLIYSYTEGRFSSRRIERSTYENICALYLTGNTHPDHDTICRFRRKNTEAIHKAFIRILLLAKEIGILKVGTVSIDGTHIKANASKFENVSYDRAEELEKRLDEDIQKLLVEAEAADTADDEDANRLPQEIARRQKLREKMIHARAEVERRARVREEREQEKAEKKDGANDTEDVSPGGGAKTDAQSEGPPDRAIPPADGQKTLFADDEPEDISAKAQEILPKGEQACNNTDPDSRIMTKGSGTQQAYNAQAVVDADGTQLIVGTRVSQCSSDRNELVNDCLSVSPDVGKPERALADAGFVNGDEVKTVEEEMGIDVLVSVRAEETHNPREYDYRPEEKNANNTPPKESKPWIKDMNAKFQKSENRKLYARRKQTVEPVFGIIKQCMGFRQFLHRGLAHVTSEWELVALAYNCKRLHRLKMTYG